MSRSRSALWIATVLVAAAILGPIQALGQSFSLKGSWSGRYSYNDGRVAVDFTLDLDADGTRCLGRIREVNTFGDKAVSHLSANVACVSMGVAPGREFRFLKQYDGTGKVSHHVQYSGTVSQDGNTITGQWTIRASGNQRDASGPFSMTRGR